MEEINLNENKDIHKGKTEEDPHLILPDLEDNKNETIHSPVVEIESKIFALDDNNRLVELVADSNLHQLNISESVLESTITSVDFVESNSTLVDQPENNSGFSFATKKELIESGLKQDDVEIAAPNNQNVSTESDLMQQVELLRIVLQTVCCELAAANIDDGNGPLLLPLWMDVLSAQELQLRLKSTINHLTADYRPAEPTETIPVLSSAPSEWIEELSSGEDSLTEGAPPFGLESPVIAHMLSTWTSDENKIVFLRSWIRSLQAPLSAGYPLGIQITNVSRVVRDGFMVLLVPIIRQLSAIDPVRVLVRQHQMSPRHAKKVRPSSRDSAEDALFSRGDDSRVIDFSDSDNEEGDSAADPFVSMESGTVFDIRIRRMAPMTTALSAAGGVHSHHAQQHAPHHHQFRGAQVSRDGADHYSMDSHFPELLSSNQVAKAKTSCFRTDSHDYSSLSEISTVFDDMDRVVAREVAAEHPVPRHVEEPYNENKPVTAATQLTTINSFISSWFKGADSGGSSVSNSDKTVLERAVAPTRSESNERVAADIIAASLAVDSSSAVSEVTLVARSAANKTQNNNKMAARLEAMRKKQ